MNYYEFRIYLDNASRGVNVQIRALSQQDAEEKIKSQYQNIRNLIYLRQVYNLWNV